MIDTADPPVILDGATAAAITAGPPGAHLSVATAQVRGDSCRGHAQVFGDDLVRHARPMTSTTVHDLGSVTKIVGTTTMLASLVSHSVLDLDARARRILPDLPVDVTVRDLLTHRAGLWEWWPIYLEADEPTAAMHAMCALPPRYRPGSGRHYSDLGFMALGGIIETVGGAVLPTLLAELVTRPLGLTGLRYGGPAPGTSAAASSIGDTIERRMIATGEPYPVTADPTGFQRWRDNVLVGEVNDGNAFHAFSGAAGHAGLFSGVDDLHRLGRALLESARGTTDRWAALPAFLRPGPDAGQLLGFRCWDSVAGDCTALAIGHTGFPGIGFAIIPSHDATVVLATNRLHVAGSPAAFDPIWQSSLHAAHRWLHATV